VYDRLGTISDNFVLRRAKSKETAHIWLARHPTTWKVHMNTRQYGLPPHAGLDGIRNWLGGFLKPPVDADDADDAKTKATKAKHLLDALNRLH
jgi:hypothetical protein